MNALDPAFHRMFVSSPDHGFARSSIDLAVAGVATVALAPLMLLIAGALIESLVRPLQTLSNVVASLREGDYSFRARGANSRDPLGELATEINALADLLQKQRVRSLEATALLARILEVMHAPLFAFDRENVLQLVNVAGTQLLQRPYARCFGHSATELGLDALLFVPLTLAGAQAAFGAVAARSPAGSAVRPPA